VVVGEESDTGMSRIISELSRESYRAYYDGDGAGWVRARMILKGVIRRFFWPSFAEVGPRSAFLGVLSPRAKRLSGFLSFFCPLPLAF
jgi:hypothetical protein